MGLAMALRALPGFLTTVTVCAALSGRDCGEKSGRQA